jgi:ankyrin repeat protein
MAADVGNNDTLAIILQHGADINCLGQDRISPLHFAALSGNSDVVVALLQHGADVNFLYYSAPC